MDAHHLGSLLDHAADSRPDHPAVVDERGRGLTYAELHHAADRLATRLARWGVGRGDRVGLFLPKSPEAVAAIHGILRAGAAYVPVDPTSPAARGAGILADAGVKAVIVDSGSAPALLAAWPTGLGPVPRLITLGEATPCPAREATWEEVLVDDAPSPLVPARVADDPAYLLYTSGSTGQPKGVVLSHANAFAFLDWCETAFELNERDRFASHAPFHFDLSTFDLFASCRHAATLVLIGEALGKDPARLGGFLAEARVDVWYSAPSILALLAEHGGIDREGFPAPRLVLFAGEVFPIGPLRQLRSAWPAARMWNLYGPTETNVCTAFRIPDVIPADRDEAFPIGTACPPALTRVVDERGRDVAHGVVGELVVAGAGVMMGYFGRPDLTARAFFLDDLGAWYRTGDLVSDDGTGCYRFHGRRDRMVKKRGYRIELGEIEAALYRNDGIDRAAVIARMDAADGLSLVAFIAMKPGHKASQIAVKRHCSQILPGYMVPDVIQFMNGLPTTSTDKVDYQGLKQLASCG
ncbi:amino acid adenylation domain-containing protein [Tundrisphaera sp. TA3]|uniref:amino acid adenylation domain-containing protein n=1 Tax=Tundrisphaera sp. TA3 TaxID=3435775 RepID=UPI003EBA9071